MDTESVESSDTESVEGSGALSSVQDFEPEDNDPSEEISMEDIEREDIEEVKINESVGQMLISGPGPGVYVHGGQTLSRDAVGEMKEAFLALIETLDNVGFEDEDLDSDDKKEILITKSA